LARYKIRIDGIEKVPMRSVSVLVRAPLDDLAHRRRLAVRDLVGHDIERPIFG
jgi:hypothetical protein